MRLVLKLLVVSAICFVGIGFYLGWFSLTKPSTDAEGNKMNVNVSVDKDKMKSDVKSAEKKIKEEIREIKGKGKATEAK